MKSETQGSPTFAHRVLRVATYALAIACACSPLAARAADRGDNPWIAWAVLVGVALLVAGILIRAALGSETPPGWLSFIARRRQKGDRRSGASGRTIDPAPTRRLSVPSDNALRRTPVRGAPPGS